MGKTKYVGWVGVEAVSLRLTLTNSNSLFDSFGRKGASENLALKLVDHFIGVKLLVPRI